ncbi:VOC family protein [candidate division KSB1 bacterium]
MLKIFLILLLSAGSLFSGCSQKDSERITEEHAAMDIQANCVFFYYEDLARAQQFYEGILGLEQVLDYGFASVHQITQTSFIGLVDEKEGMHSSQEPKTATLAIVTDELEKWYDYLQEQGVEMHRTYDPANGRAHHGFVAIDPEGYFIEFERFTEHPENALLMPIISNTETTYPPPGQVTSRNRELGIQTTVLWLYYRDLDSASRYYEDVFGFDQIVEQDFSNIYRSAPSSFIGLVDESRGLHRFSEEKSVTVSFISEDIDNWYAHLNEKKLQMRNPLNNSEREPVRAFVTYDIEGYFLEFDWFLKDVRNETILAILEK